MKTAFVVLLLFVVYSSGVILPSVVSKAINKTVQISSANSSKEIFIEKNLEKSNKIDEKELFQTAADKENVLKERSFIFINQLFKMPLRNQLYNSQTHNLNKPFTISERLPQVNVIPSSSVQAKVSPLKELFIPNIKIKGASFSRYDSPNYKYLDGEQKNRFRDDKYTLQKVVHEGVPIKPAVLRPLSKSFEENIDRKSTVLKPEDTIKHYKNKKPLETSYAFHRINYNYGFPSPYQHGSVFQNNDISSKTDDISSEGGLVTDNIGNLSPLDLNDGDEDKLLERYIKETLEEFNVNDMAANNDPKKCQKCKSKGNKTKAQTNAILNCKCHNINYPQNEKINVQKPDKNKYESNQKESMSLVLESNENDRLFAYGDDKTINDASFNDNTLI